MRIKLTPTNHREVKVTTAYGSTTTPAELLRYIRETETKLRAKQWARDKYAAERQSRAANQDVPQIGTRPATTMDPGPSIKG